MTTTAVEPDLDTVMTENAELRAALATYLPDGADIDAVLDEGISTTRSGEVRFTQPEAEAAEGDPEPVDEPAEGDSTTEPSAPPAPKPKPRRPSSAPTGRSKPAADPFSLDPKAIADGSSDADFFESAAVTLYGQGESDG